MKVQDLIWKRLLLACAVVSVVIAVIVFFGVIPRVKADTFPLANPDKAAIGFGINSGLILLVSVILFFMAFKSRERKWTNTLGLIILGFVILLLGLALTDAASAFQGHGPMMQSTSMLLFFCAAVDELNGLAVIITTLLRPKKILI